ncbi:hypothetical protein HCU62_05680 [Dissulfurirhabdus thermomarina]|nr:hypothetical protein [Dissulfurirhabdus thermomarina]
MKPVPKLSLKTNLSWTTGTGEISDLFFNSIYPTGDAKLDLDTSSVNPNQPHLYDTAYINGSDAYSDLDFDEINVTVGVSYKVTEALGVGVNYYFDYFRDDQPYVYGDQDSGIQSVMGYVSYGF